MGCKCIKGIVLSKEERLKIAIGTKFAMNLPGMHESRFISCAKYELFRLFV